MRIYGFEQAGTEVHCTKHKRADGEIELITHLVRTLSVAEVRDGDCSRATGNAHSAVHELFVDHQEELVRIDQRYCP